MGHYAMGGERPVPIRVKPVEVGSLPGCQNAEASCDEWAASGESTAGVPAVLLQQNVVCWNRLPVLPQLWDRQD